MRTRIPPANVCLLLFPANIAKIKGKNDVCCLISMGVNFDISRNSIRMILHGRKNEEKSQKKTCVVVLTFNRRFDAVMGLMIYTQLFNGSGCVLLERAAIN
jgi:hypothetical protein